MIGIFYDTAKLVVAMLAGIGLATMLFLLGVLNFVQVQVPY